MFFDNFDSIFAIDSIELFSFDFCDSFFVRAFVEMMNFDFSDFIFVNDFVEMINFVSFESMIAFAFRDRRVLNTQFVHFEQTDN